jgi:hypothetical protein
MLEKAKAACKATSTDARQLTPGLIFPALPAFILIL